MFHSLPADALSGTTTAAELLELARFRQGAYRLLAAWLLYPDRAVVEVAPSAAGLLREYDAFAIGLTYWDSWDRLLRALEQIGIDEFPSLERSYMRLFGESRAQQPISLCETGYVAAPDLVAQITGSVATQYVASGLAVSTGEMPDHAAVELEYLSFLCDNEGATRQEAVGLKKGCATTSRVLERQQSFLKEHLSMWMPAMSRQVAKRDQGIYALICSAASALVVGDLDLVTIMLSGGAD